jgi:hypothetical protein
MIFPRDKSYTISAIPLSRLPKLVGVGIRVGMGSEIGRPSIIGLAQPPLAESKPFLEKIMRTMYDLASRLAP